MIRTSESKLNNFCRIEPSLHQLDVMFDTNVARDVMNEKQGTAARLLYQLFVALSKKKKKGPPGTAADAGQHAAPTKLEAISSVMYKEARIFLFYRLFHALE